MAVIKKKLRRIFHSKWFEYQFYFNLKKDLIINFSRKFSRFVMR